MVKISIRAARVNAHLNREKAAELLGISTATLVRYENKSPKKLPAGVLEKMAEVYKIPLDFIF